MANLSFTAAQIDAALLAAPETQLNYNQIVPTVRASVNVSSVTDSSAGDFTVNFTSTYANINYFVSTCAGDTTNGGNYWRKLDQNIRATGSLDCASGFVLSGSEGAADGDSNMVQVSGTLA